MPSSNPKRSGSKAPSTQQLTNLQTQELIKAPTNAGTQVGSEGVKAPRANSGEIAVEGVTLARKLRGEAIDIIP